jgi:hypothetical protein
MLQKNLPKTRTAPEKEVLQRMISSTDRRIDELVYELCREFRGHITQLIVISVLSGRHPPLSVPD